MMRQARITLIAVFSIVISMSLACPSTHAATGPGTTMVGYITYAKGAVLVRTKAKWRILKKTPWPVYVTDRIVTKRGRASINLIDGGIVRMNTDTSLRIIRKEISSGLFSSKKTNATEINVLAGNVWFKIELKRIKAMRFRTPSMTAAIRGTEGDFEVTLNGKTNLDLKSGKTNNTGTYSKLPSTSDTQLGTELHKSSARFLNSHQIKAVNEAIQKQQIADRASSRALKLQQIADRLNRPAQKTTKITRAAQAAIKAALQKSNASEADTRALISVIAEEKISAKTLHDSAYIKASEKSALQARTTLAKVVESNNKVQSMGEGSMYTQSYSLTAILSSLISTMAYHTDSLSASALADTMGVLGHSVGNAKAAVVAEDHANKARMAAHDVLTLRNQLSTILSEVTKGFRGKKEEAVVKASQIISKAAAVQAADARAHANIAVEIVCGDSKSQKVGGKALKLFSLGTRKALELTENLTQAVEAADMDLLDSLLEQMEDLEDAAEELAGEGETPADIPDMPAIEDLEGTVVPDTHGEEPPEEEPTSPAEDIPPFDPTGDSSGTGDRNVSPYTF